MDTTIKLPDEVGKAYKLAKHAVRELYHGSVGRVDLNKISMKQAKKLADAGVLLPVSGTDVKEKK